MQLPLVNKKYLLEKFPGKGGWTYARLPDIVQDRKAPFGWVRVKGKIDDHEISNYHLMPIGNGQLFLPVKAEIRKKIRKSAGDEVHVILYADDSPIIIPEELQACLLDEPKAHESFLKLRDGEKKAFIDWINSAKKEETKADRIVKTINKLLRNQKPGDQ